MSKLEEKLSVMQGNANHFGDFETLALISALRKALKQRNDLNCQIDHGVKHATERWHRVVKENIECLDAEILKILEGE